MEADIRTELAVRNVREQTAVAAFMNRVYGWMGVGLGVTGVVAYAISLWLEQNLEWLAANSWAMWVVFGIQLLMVFTMSAKAMKMPAALATMLFILYAVVTGVSLSVLFVIYTKSSIASTFLVTGGSFAALSIFGATTKRDLSGMGGILTFLLIGVFIGSIVNWFWANSTLYWIITYAGVVVFALLTAYDTQKIRQLARDVDSENHISAGHAEEMRQRASILGALVLYLDFIGLFVFLIRILGDRR
jgi:FtsH-binding integral membrane protein